MNYLMFVEKKGRLLLNIRNQKFKKIYSPVFLCLWVRFHLVSLSFIMKQCDYFWSWFNTHQQDLKKKKKRWQSTISSVVDAPLVGAAKFKEQAKGFLIESWLDIEVI